MTKRILWTPNTDVNSSAKLRSHTWRTEFTSGAQSGHFLKCPVFVQTESELRVDKNIDTCIFSILAVPNIPAHAHLAGYNTVNSQSGYINEIALQYKLQAHACGCRRSWNLFDIPQCLIPVSNSSLAPSFHRRDGCFRTTLRQCASSQAYIGFCLGSGVFD